MSNPIKLCDLGNYPQYLDDDLAFVPDEFITQELCERAVARDGCNIAHVPEQYLTIDLMVTALGTSKHSGYYVRKRTDSSTWYEIMKKYSDTITPSEIVAAPEHVDTIRPRVDTSYGATIRSIMRSMMRWINRDRSRRRFLT